MQIVSQDGMMQPSTLGDGTQAGNFGDYVMTQRGSIDVFDCGANVRLSLQRALTMFWSASCRQLVRKVPYPQPT